MTLKRFELENPPGAIPIESHVRSANLITEVRSKAQPFLSRLAAKPETVGVGILGGVAQGGRREFADEVSDIDITLLISLPLSGEMLMMPWPSFVHAVQSQLPDWLPNFKFIDPESNIEINVHQHILEYETQPHIVWDNEKCEAYAETLESVHDPQGELQRLVTDKTSCRPERGRAALLRLLTYSRNLVDSGVVKCLHRGRSDSAGEILLRALHEAVDSVFYLSDRWPPHPKWRYSSLAALPDCDGPIAEIRQAIVEMVAMTPDTPASCLRIRESLLHVLVQIEELTATQQPDWPEDPYGYAVSQFFPDRQLRIHTSADRMWSDRQQTYASRMEDRNWNMHNSQLTTPR